MDLITDYIEPRELSILSREEFVRVHPREDNTFFGNWFPNDYTDDPDFKFNPGGSIDVNIVPWRAWDAESPVGQRPGLETARGQIPPLSQKDLLGEYENLRRRVSAETAIRDVIISDAQRQARGIARSLELARAEALLRGKIDVRGTGITVDFGRDPTHTTTPNVAWGTSATADPITDLLAWQDRIEDANYAVDMIVTSRRVVRAATRAKKVIDAIKGATVAVTQVTVDELNALLVSEGLPPFTVYNGTVAGTRTIGDDQLLMLPSPMAMDSAVGVTRIGMPLEAFEDVYDLDLENGEGPGLVSGVYKTTDPVGVWTKTSAVALPILAAPNATLSAKVLA